MSQPAALVMPPRVLEAWRQVQSVNLFGYNPKGWHLVEVPALWVMWRKEAYRTARGFGILRNAQKLYLEDECGTTGNARL